jgi:hypothetical protein
MGVRAQWRRFARIGVRDTGGDSYGVFSREQLLFRPMSKFL